MQHRRSVVPVEHRVAEAVEHRRPDDLVAEERRLEHRDGREGRLDITQVRLLALAPPPEVAVHLGWEHAIHHDGVGQVAVEVEVSERPPGLVDDHPIGVHHQPDRDVLVVAQDLVHSDQVPHEPLDVVEHRVAREREVEHRPRERPRGRQDRRALREDLLQPPPGDVGERQQP